MPLLSSSPGLGQQLVDLVPDSLPDAFTSAGLSGAKASNTYLNVATGNVLLHEVDVSIANRDFALEISRSFNTIDGMWRFSWQDSLINPNKEDKQLIRVAADGAEIIYDWSDEQQLYICNTQPHCGEIGRAHV